MFFNSSEWWCLICDSNVVNSEKKETGKTFKFNAHIIDNNNNVVENVIVEGKKNNWPKVILPICSECLKTFENSMDKFSIK